MGNLDHQSHDKYHFITQKTLCAKVFIMDDGGHILSGHDVIRGGVANKHLGDFSCLGTQVRVAANTFLQTGP